MPVYEPIAKTHFGYVSGRWYSFSGFGVHSVGLNPGAGSIRLYPIIIRSPVVIDTLGVRCNTGHAGGNIQAAIYTASAGTKLPIGEELVATASMAADNAGVLSASASLILAPGLYWAATNCDNTTNVFDSVGASAGEIPELIGTATQSSLIGGSGSSMSGLSTAASFGTWPDLTAASFTAVAASSIPTLHFKVA